MHNNIFRTLFAFLLLFSLSTVNLCYANNTKQIIATSQDDIWLNGQNFYVMQSEKSLYPIKYNDTNYVPLSVAETIIAKNIEWDSLSNTLIVKPLRNKNDTHIVQDTTDPPIYRNVTICYSVNSKMQSDIILYKNNIYIPIRVLCSIDEKDIFYDDLRKQILIKNKTSNELKQQEKEYINNILTLTNNIQSNIDDLYVQLDNEYAKDKLKKNILEIKSMPVPNVDYIKNINDIVSNTADTIYNIVINSESLDYEIIEDIEMNFSTIQYFSFKVRQFDF